MDLNKFAELISLNDSNVAKNTLSYLIGNGYSDNEWGEALAGLYNAFPNQIKESKEDKKAFLPIIIKYFFKYELTNENISIYNEYEEIIPAKDKNKIKEFNLNWSWKGDEITFKNSNDFSKALQEKHNKKFDFIKQYQDQFDNLLKTQKDKMLQHFEKKNVWYGLLAEDYSEFVSLCEKLDVNRLEILQKSMKYRAVNNIYFVDSKKNNFEKYLDDIYETKESFEGLITKNKYDKEQNSIYGILLRTISSKNYECAIKFITKFENEFIDYFKMYDIPFDGVLSIDNFKEIVSKKIKINDGYGSYGAREEISLLTNIIKDDNWLRTLANYELFNEINMDKKKPTKQLKI